MTIVTRRFVLAAAVALVTSGSVIADSGDNSMSPFTGESYAAFNGGNLGAPTREAPYPLAEPENPVAEEGTAVADTKWPYDVIIGLPREHSNPFRDDTAA